MPVYFCTTVEPITVVGRGHASLLHDCGVYLLAAHSLRVQYKFIEFTDHHSTKLCVCATDVAKCPDHSCTFTATTASCSECAAGKYTGEEGLAECADCEVRRLLFAIFHQYHALPSSHHYVRAAK